MLYVGHTLHVNHPMLPIPAETLMAHEANLIVSTVVVAIDCALFHVHDVWSSTGELRPRFQP